MQHVSRDADGAAVEQFTIGAGGGTQRGARYFGEARTLAELDLYRLEKLHAGSSAAAADTALFRALCRDAGHFGYLDVTAGDHLSVRYMRYRPETDDFGVDYEFVR